MLDTLRALCAVGVCAAVLSVFKVLLLECNIHWVHLLATYPEVAGYPVSASLGMMLEWYFGRDGCLPHVPEFTVANMPDPSRWPDETRPFTVRSAFVPLAGPGPVLKHFCHEFQNQFQVCEDESPLTPLVPEAVPCLNISFCEMVRRLDPAHPQGRPWQVFNKVLSRGDLSREEEMLRSGLGTPAELAALHRHSAIWPHVVVVASRDQPSVPYYHSHPDYFVVWNVVGAKDWYLLPPSRLPSVQAVWSGLTFVATRDPTAGCAAKVVQGPGDLLVVPPWWLHKVELPPQQTSAGNIGHLGYSQHFAPKTSVVGHVLHVLEDLFGPSWGMAVNLAPRSSFFDAVAGRESAGRSQ